MPGVGHRGHDQLHLADPDRLNVTMPLAAQYAPRSALAMDKNIPSTADGRVALAMEVLVPKAEELGVPMSHLYLGPWF